MDYIGGILVLAAVVFGICFLVDKGFTKLFRSRTQHITGLSVRLNKHIASFGVILAVLGAAALLAGVSADWRLCAGGGVLLLMGAGVITYYLSFGIFYDADSFVVTTFGKRGREYTFGEIRGQMLYSNHGYALVELHMADGRTVHIQQTMTGVVEFLNHAYKAWLRQTGRREEDCDFHDPGQNRWFPPVE